MILCKNGRIFLVCSKKKNNEERPENGESQGEERSCLPSFLPLQEFQLSALYLSIPVGQSGGNPTEKLPGPSVGLEGACKGRSLPPSLSAASPCV